jgi:hypothetical protein
MQKANNDKQMPRVKKKKMPNIEAISLIGNGINGWKNSLLKLFGF